MYSPSRAFLRALPFGPAVLLCSCVSDSIRPFPDPISSALSRFSLSRFPFRRFRLYQILSGLIPSQRGLSSQPLGRSDVPNFSGSSRQFLIGPPRPNRIEFGHAEFTRLGDRAGGLGAATAAEALPQNRYGPVATRRTLRIQQGDVNHPCQDLLFEVAEPAARVRLGVLHAS